MVIRPCTSCSRRQQLVPMYMFVGLRFPKVAKCDGIITLANTLWENQMDGPFGHMMIDSKNVSESVYDKVGVLS